MRVATYFAALGATLGAVVAAPLRGRELVVNTVTEIDTVTEYITATVWVDPASSTSSSTTSSTYVTPTPVIATTTAAVTPTSTTTSTSTSSSTSTSLYVAPAAPAAETPVANAPAVQIQTPTTTSTYVAPPAPTTTTTPAPAPAATTPAATTSSSGSSNAPSSSYTGEITYYDAGLGSCGMTNTNSDMIVAMAHGMMNKATMCGKTITISYQGVTQQATVVDTCMSCVNGDLDLTPALFKAVAPNGDGRVSGVSWWFN